MRLRGPSDDVVGDFMGLNRGKPDPRDMKDILAKRNKSVRLPRTKPPLSGFDKWRQEGDSGGGPHPIAQMITGPAVRGGQFLYGVGRRIMGGGRQASKRVAGRGAQGSGAQRGQARQQSQARSRQGSNVQSRRGQDFQAQQSIRSQEVFTRPRTPAPSPIVSVRNKTPNVGASPPPVGSSVQAGKRVSAGGSPGTHLEPVNFRPLPRIAGVAAVSLATSAELTRRLLDTPAQKQVEVPKSKFTDMVGISFGDMGRTEEVAERNNQPTILNSNIKSKRRNSPGQKNKNDTLNLGVGSKKTTTYEVQLRGGDIFPLDKTIGKLAAFPVTVIGKVLKVGGGLLTEE